MQFPPPATAAVQPVAEKLDAPVPEIALLTVKLAVPTLVTVRFRVVGLRKKALPKARVVAASLTSVPVPVAPASSGLEGSVLAITRVVEEPPTVVGSKLTVMVQAAPLANGPPPAGQVPPVMEYGAPLVR